MHSLTNLLLLLIILWNFYLLLIIGLHSVDQLPLLSREIELIISLPLLLIFELIENEGIVPIILVRLEKEGGILRHLLLHSLGRARGVRSHLMGDAWMRERFLVYLLKDLLL